VRLRYYLYTVLCLCSVQQCSKTECTSGPHDSCTLLTSIVTQLLIGLSYSVLSTLQAHICTLQAQCASVSSTALSHRISGPPTCMQPGCFRLPIQCSKQVFLFWRACCQWLCLTESGLVLAVTEDGHVHAVSTSVATPVMQCSFLFCNCMFF
jgi:hypothetical protein